MAIEKYFLNREHAMKMMDIGFNEPCLMYWDNKGDQVFNKFEKKMVDFTNRYTGLSIYVRGRGVTEKGYWLSQKESNRFPKF